MAGSEAFPDIILKFLLYFSKIQHIAPGGYGTDDMLYFLCSDGPFFSEYRNFKDCKYCEF